MDLNITSSSGKQYSMPIADQNETLVRRSVTKFDHPHPLFLMAIGVIVIVVIYMLFISFIKPSFSGTWYHEGQTIKVTHNKFNDTFTVNDALVGTVVGNALYINSSSGMKIGVVHGRKIIWSDGSIWQHPIEAFARPVFGAK